MARLGPDWGRCALPPRVQPEEPPDLSAGPLQAWGRAGAAVWEEAAGGAGAAAGGACQVQAGPRRCAARHPGIYAVSFWAFTPSSKLLITESGFQRAGAASNRLGPRVP